MKTLSTNDAEHILKTLIGFVKAIEKTSHKLAILKPALKKDIHKSIDLLNEAVSDKGIGSDEMSEEEIKMYIENMSEKDWNRMKPELKKKYKKYRSLKGVKSSTETLIDEIVKRRKITEKEMKLLLKRKNAGEKFDDSPIWNNVVFLSEDQSKKGLKYLKNLWKSPNGKERKNNPFGQREENIISDFEHFILKGFYDAGNSSHSFWVPLYEVVGNETSMDYYVAGGKINLVG